MTIHLTNLNECSSNLQLQLHISSFTNFIGKYFYIYLKNNSWDEQAHVINFGNKKNYCKAYYNLKDSWNDEIKTIETIWKSFQRKLIKLEKMLILIQERKHFTNTNDIKVRITEEDEEKLYELNNILSKKIEKNFRFYKEFFIIIIKAKNIKFYLLILGTLSNKMIHY